MYGPPAWSTAVHHPHQGIHVVGSFSIGTLVLFLFPFLQLLLEHNSASEKLGSDTYCYAYSLHAISPPLPMHRLVMDPGSWRTTVTVCWERMDCLSVHVLNSFNLFIILISTLSSYKAVDLITDVYVPTYCMQLPILTWVRSSAVWIHSLPSK